MSKTGKNTTEHDKHVAGGPGKSAHNEKPGNKPGQNQTGEGRERGAGSGGGRGASEEQSKRTS